MINDLRKAALEIAAAGHAGWGNACTAGADAIEALQARVVELDRSETQLIQERDEREEVINALCDAVLGTDRYEWSSMYSFDDAVEEVAVKTAVLDKEVSELYALRKERDALAAELAAARAQEPVSYRYKFTHPISGEPVWRDSSLMWNGQCVQEVQPLFAAPVPPVREPLSGQQVDYEKAADWLSGHAQGLIDGKAIRTCKKCNEPISEIADCNSATCPTMQDFNSWWYASKYMQVVNASSGTRQAAIDGWNAAIEAAHGIKEQK